VRRSYQEHRLKNIDKNVLGAKPSIRRYEGDFYKVIFGKRTAWKQKARQERASDQKWNLFIVIILKDNNLEYLGQTEGRT